MGGQLHICPLQTGLLWIFADALGAFSFDELNFFAINLSISCIPIFMFITSNNIIKLNLLQQYINLISLKADFILLY